MTLAYFALLLALMGASIVLGWLPLALGPWPGISLGFAALMASVIALRTKPKAPTQRWSAWAAAVLGSLAALGGIAIYLGMLVLASRLR